MPSESSQPEVGSCKTGPCKKGLERLEPCDGKLSRTVLRGGSNGDITSLPDTKEQLNRFPKLYQTENIPLRDKLIHFHFFIGGCDWYIAEYDGEDLFWGYAILNGDLEMAEWGYISFQELKDLKIPPGFEVECDGFWHATKASEVEKIRMGNNWPEKEKTKIESSGKEKRDDTRSG